MVMRYWTQRALTEQTPPEHTNQLYCARLCHWRHENKCSVFGECHQNGEINIYYTDEELERLANGKGVDLAMDRFWPSTLRHPDCISMRGYFMKESSMDKTFFPALDEAIRSVMKKITVEIEWTDELDETWNMLEWVKRIFQRLYDADGVTVKEIPNSPVTEEQIQEALKDFKSRGGIVTKLEEVGE